MRIFRLSLLLSLSLMFAVQCYGQDETSVDFDAFIAELNAQCPILDGDNWSINSFTASGDTAYVELLVPTNLKMFLSMLTSNTDNVRRLWLQQLSHYGDNWNHFIDQLVATRRMLILTVLPKDTDESATIKFTADQLQRYVEDK